VPDTASSAELEVLTTQRLAGDFCRLHPALGLKPWEPSPLPLDVDKAEPPDGGAIRGVRACGRRGNRAAPWMWPSVTAFRTSASIALTNVLGARTGWGVYCLGRMAFALWPQIVAHAVAAKSLANDEPAFYTEEEAMPRQLYLFALAFALATGAFWLTMLKDPPRSVASDPAGLTEQSFDIKVPTGLPSFEDDYKGNTDGFGLK
jgi:hypothetical protein